jgi:hypothetical protein
MNLQNIRKESSVLNVKCLFVHWQYHFTVYILYSDISVFCPLFCEEVLACHIRKRVMLKIILDFKFCYAFAYISGEHLSYFVWDEDTIWFAIEVLSFDEEY